VEGTNLFITPIEAASLEILADQKKRPEKITGLKVNPVFGESFVIPMTARTATEIEVELVAQANE
jgi:hypothetical protein